MYNKSCDHLVPFYAEMKEAVNAFLMANGGMSNGYRTYINDTIYSDTLTSIHWETPDIDDITKRERDKRGSILNEKLRQILIKYSLEHCKIVSIFGSHGFCNEIRLEVTMSEQIR